MHERFSKTYRAVLPIQSKRRKIALLHLKTKPLLMGRLFIRKDADIKGADIKGADNKDVDNTPALKAATCFKPSAGTPAANFKTARSTPTKTAA